MTQGAYSSDQAFPFTAGGTITEWQLVKRSAADTVVVSSVAYEECVGIATVEASSGQIVSVQVGDISIAIAGGTIHIGNQLTSNGDGTLIAATAGHNSDIMGRALEDAASGDKFRMVIDHAFLD